MTEPMDRRNAKCLHCEKIIGIVALRFEGELKCTNCGSINHFHKTEEPTR